MAMQGTAGTAARLPCCPPTSPLTLVPGVGAMGQQTARAAPAPTAGPPPRAGTGDGLAMRNESSGRGTLAEVAGRAWTRGQVMMCLPAPAPHLHLHLHLQLHSFQQAPGVAEWRWLETADGGTPEGGKHLINGTRHG